MDFEISGNVVDVPGREIFAGRLHVSDGVIARIERLGDPREGDSFLMPGFVDSHIHVESSMLLPAGFARAAVVHGTVGTVSDPHEIANVCGIEGVELMLRSAAQVNFKFCFGAPSCVPATGFETAGATLDAIAVGKLLQDPRIGYLSEVMNYPGVLAGVPEIMEKIAAAKKAGKPVDGHAPGLRGEQAEQYIKAGITTDHECVSSEEAIDKIRAGCMIAIREGSAARNFEALQELIDQFPESCMFCSDDKHPDDFLNGHINQLASRAIAHGRELFNVLHAGSVHAVRHYGLDVGLLQEGDPADLIEVSDLNDFQVRKTYINGILVAKDGECLIPSVEPEVLNRFDATQVSASQFEIPARGKQIRVIEAIDGELITRQSTRPALIRDGKIVSDPETDVLKIAVINRYTSRPEPSVAMISGFGLRSGALASSVAHDCHNVVAVGVGDEEIVAAVNAVIESGGGLSFHAAGRTQRLPLPVAGLMSTLDCQQVADEYSKLNEGVERAGCRLRAPYMTLSFMALLVIPSLKLSDRGLFDAERFEFVDLFVD